MLFLPFKPTTKQGKHKRHKRTHPFFVFITKGEATPPPIQALRGEQAAAVAAAVAAVPEAWSSPPPTLGPVFWSPGVVTLSKSGFDFWRALPWESGHGVWISSHLGSKAIRIPWADACSFQAGCGKSDWPALSKDKQSQPQGVHLQTLVVQCQTERALWMDFCASLPVQADPDLTACFCSAAFTASCSR